ncbi:hypothetical protein B7494_g6648 [Chlorociboria aeruginascens]|nr:hypothetical protein B7494_g6648 [Chlorociboria aeruginascens]
MGVGVAVVQYTMDRECKVEVAGIERGKAAAWRCNVDAAMKGEACRNEAVGSVKCGAASDDAVRLESGYRNVQSVLRIPTNNGIYLIYK